MAYPLIVIIWSLNTMKLIKTMASTRRDGFHQKECTPRGEKKMRTGAEKLCFTLSVYSFKGKESIPIWIIK